MGGIPVEKALSALERLERIENKILKEWKRRSDDIDGKDNGYPPGNQSRRTR